MTELNPDAYCKALRQFLEPHRNEENATPMKAYMKGRYEFFEIKTTKKRALAKEFYQEYGIPEQDELDKYIKARWNEPEREIHHIAQEIAGTDMKKAKPKVVSLYEYMITHNSWWDTVDYISIWLAGRLFMSHPEMIEEYTEKWMASGNFWLQRCALLFQRDFKENTDEKLLFDLCTRLAGKKEFFIRKAIGWILREYSKTNPKAIEDFVNKTALSPLSKKEALRRIKK